MGGDAEEGEKRREAVDEEEEGVESEDGVDEAGEEFFGEDGVFFDLWDGVSGRDLWGAGLGTALPAR